MRTVSAAILVSFLLSVPAVAAEPGAAGDSPLEPLAWLVGRWTTEIQRPDGTPLKVDLDYQWAGHRKALRYTIGFTLGDRSVTQYEGMYWWDPATNQARMLQVDAQGNVTHSQVRFEDKTIHQENQVSRADGGKGEQRIRSVRTGDDEFDFTAMVLRDGEWVQAVSLKYQRVKDVPAATTK